MNSKSQIIDGLLAGIAQSKSGSRKPSLESDDGMKISSFEQRILRSSVPIEVDETDRIKVFGEEGTKRLK